jgi:hypothetical protein
MLRIRAHNVTGFEEGVEVNFVKLGLFFMHAVKVHIAGAFLGDLDLHPYFQVHTERQSAFTCTTSRIL